MSFEDALPSRLEALVDHQVPAAALFGGPYYFAEQLGFREIIDTTFMIATMIHGDPEPEDLDPRNTPVLEPAIEQSLAAPIKRLSATPRL